MIPDPALLDSALRNWLPQQRWFGGKGRQLTSVTSEVREVRAGEPAVFLAVVTVTYPDAGPEVYSVPITTRSATDEGLAHALIGEVGADSQLLAFDALLDRDATPIWCELLESGADLDWLRFDRMPETEIPTGIPGDILSSEQSNSSLIYGDQAITKFFRRIEPGINPDVEVHAALGAGRNPHLATLLGHTTLTTESMTATLAMTQGFLPVASDGWSLATTSVRDLFAEGDLHADEVGGDFAGEAHRLGLATASVHADLALVLPTETADRDWYATLADRMRGRLRDAIAIVPELEAHQESLLQVYAALEGATEPTSLQRIHGDLHLGQVLRTPTGWTLLDFEGEPAKPIPERRALDAAVRDVAGMLRSFDYAAWSLLLDGGADPQLQYRAIEWADRNRDAFCSGYAEAAGVDPRDNAVLLSAFEADKAVYEAVYETRNRPAWIAIPLHSLRRLGDGRSS